MVAAPLTAASHQQRCSGELRKAVLPTMTAAPYATNAVVISSRFGAPIAAIRLIASLTGE